MKDFEKLERQYDRMQKIYGDPGLHAIYYGGCLHQPETAFVFMNPTGRNLAASLDWPGKRVPRVGNKLVWQLFWQLGFLPQDLYHEVLSRKPQQWTVALADKLYEALDEQGVFVTNLAKCTQPDARPLPDRVYREYLPFFLEEMALVRPKRIVAFGNQVSSAILGQKISVSRCRRQSFPLELFGERVPVYPVFYPVGNGRMNYPKALADLQEILSVNPK